jgi:hypothetical protein
MVTYSTNDGTAAANSTESTYYEVSDTAYRNYNVEELLQEIKKKIVHPWMTLPPSGRFEKPLMIFKTPVYDRKLLINAYKTSARK